MRKTKIINLIGGPGAGKSTMCAGIFSRLKMKGIDCELSSEYAKELVWESRNETFKDEVYIFAKQNHRLFRLNGKVDVVITDRPLIMSNIYNQYYNPDRKIFNKVFEEFIKANWNMYDNINIFIKRDKQYNPNGRNETLEQAKEFDNLFKNYLDGNNIDYVCVDGNEKGLNTAIDYVIDILDNEKEILNKGENNIMENEKKKTMWVTIPERYIHEFTKEFTSDQKGNALPEPVTKKYYAVNIPTKDGKNMSFFVNAKVQHPQIKNYVIIPINEGERGVTFSHLEKDENGKNSYVKEEPVVKLSQSHLSEIVKEAFSKINDEATKYLIVPNSSIDYRTKLKLNNDTFYMDVKEEWKIIVLPDYMKEYKGHMLAGATMLAPFQYENTKDENLAVFRIDENAQIELWEHGDRNKIFHLSGRELITLNKNNYKTTKAVEDEKAKNEAKKQEREDREDKYNEFISKVHEEALKNIDEKNDIEWAKDKIDELTKQNPENISEKDSKSNDSKENDASERE